MHPSRRVPLHDLRAVPPGLRAVAWRSRCQPHEECRAGVPAANAEAPAAVAAAAVPTPAVSASAAAGVDGEAGTGLPLEELMALEALAAQAEPSHGQGPESEDDVGFGGFDD